MEANELALVAMPVMDIQTALLRRNQMVEFVQDIMKEGQDYGRIPGVDKNTLLKPGAEKLTTFFGLRITFELVDKTEDWTGTAHGGEAFFHYHYTAQAWKGDALIAEADGSCNSWEAKYRYRKAERVCPNCGAAAIIKGRPDWGGGWVCWDKRGGCKSKFADGNPDIENQEVGQISNPNPAEQVNTIVKMSQKRALVAVTLLAVNASEFFTQDVEDMEIVETAGAKSVTPISAWPKAAQDRFMFDLRRMGVASGDMPNLLKEWGDVKKFSDLPWTESQATVAVAITKHAFAQGMELNDVHQALGGTIGDWVVAGKDIVEAEKVIAAYIQSYSAPTEVTEDEAIPV